jgi:protein LSM14
LPPDDFDFQSNLQNFKKGDEEDDEAGDVPEVMAVGTTGAYDKDDFFDSISCDALDKEHGIDSRLRGSAERNLNTETFGAIALNSQRRRKGRGSGGGSRGGRGEGGGRGRSGRGEGSGRSRGRGRGRGARGGGRDSEWSSYRREDNSGGPPRQSATSATSS